MQARQESGRNLEWRVSLCRELRGDEVGPKAAKEREV